MNKEFKEQEVLILGEKEYKVEKRLSGMEGSQGQIYILTDGRQQFIAKVKFSLCEELDHEYNMLLKLSSAYVIKTYGYFVTDKYCLLLVDYGTELSSYIRNSYNLDERIRFFSQIVEAVDFCHSKGVFHRDLKLQNIVVKDGICKLIDFGIAISAPICKGYTGTPGFIADEATYSDYYDCSKADIYALGIILFILLTNRDLFILMYRKLYNYDPNRFWEEYVPFLQYPVLMEYKPLFDGLLESNPCRRWKMSQIKEFLKNPTNTTNPKKYLLLKKKDLKFTVTNQSVPLDFGAYYINKNKSYSVTLDRDLNPQMYIDCKYVFRVSEDCFNAFSKGAVIHISKLPIQKLLRKSPKKLRKSKKSKKSKKTKKSI